MLLCRLPTGVGSPPNAASLPLPSPAAVQSGAPADCGAGAGGRLVPVRAAAGGAKFTARHRPPGAGLRRQLRHGMQADICSAQLMSLFLLMGLRVRTGWLPGNGRKLQCGLRWVVNWVKVRSRQSGDSGHEEKAALAGRGWLLYWILACCANASASWLMPGRAGAGRCGLTRCLAAGGQAGGGGSGHRCAGLQTTRHRLDLLLRSPCVLWTASQPLYV